MGTDVQLAVVSEDAGQADQALHRASLDLEETEQALSRFRNDSELSRLNAEGALQARPRLFAAVEAAIQAYEWSDGLIDPRVIESLEAFGYRESLPSEEVGDVEAPEPQPEVDMRYWISSDDHRVTLPPGVRLDLAGVGKALGIGWAARCLAGHMGLLVDVGGDVIALGHDEKGRPWSIGVRHARDLGEFSGTALAVATSTTARRAWKSGGREAHHIIDPRTGSPSTSDIVYATVAAPTILEADLAAKLLVIGGREALVRDGLRGYRIALTDRRGRVEMPDPDTPDAVPHMEVSG